MSTTEGARLAQVIRRNIEEIRRLCDGLDDATASRAPAGRWSPKEILSHLCGPEGVGVLPTIQAILEKESPRLDVEPANSFFTEHRSRMSLAELLAELERQYSRMAEFAEGFSPQQLSRTAHVPLFKETAIGEYPTLAGWIGALGDFHFGFHIDHLKEILQALGTTPQGGISPPLFT